MEEIISSLEGIGSEWSKQQLEVCCVRVHVSTLRSHMSPFLKSFVSHDTCSHFVSCHGNLTSLSLSQVLSKMVSDLL